MTALGSLTDFPVLMRGGGDLATGVIHRLHGAGLPVGIVELQSPLSVRRLVSLGAAVYERTVTVEGVTSQLVNGSTDWSSVIVAGQVPVTVSEGLPGWMPTPAVIVDARLAKRNIDTQRGDADFVVGLGPGFTAGDDCDAVIETNRGPHLGRLITDGGAEPNTGTPGIVGGRGRERVLRAPATGQVDWHVDIGDLVTADQLLGEIAGHSILAPFDGVVRGLIHPKCTVEAGVKIGDIDPRADTRCDEISDKALAIGGAVLAAVLDWLNRRDA